MSVYMLNQAGLTYGGRRRRVEALHQIDLRIEEHQRWGVVGESGSGKTTLLKVLAGLTPANTGQVEFLDQPLDLSDKSTMARLRRNVQMVFQDPRSSLDPRMRVGEIVAEPLRSPLFKGHTDAERTKRRVAEVLDAVGLPSSSARLYPHEFSGGQRQRIALARALAPHPQVLLADEPVSALDVSVRAHVLNLINDLVDDMGLTLVMVTHDLAVVRHSCDHVGVLRQGRLVESGPTEVVLTQPSQAYTAELLSSVPRLAPLD